MKQNARPSDLELQVLSVLWDKGPCTAREVNAAMPDGKKRAYTTVLTVLQVMERKGLVTHTSQGRANVYAAKGAKRSVLKPLLKDWVTNVFGGSPKEAVQQLLDTTEVTGEELDAIRRLLDEKQAEGQKGQGE